MADAVVEFLLHSSYPERLIKVGNAAKSAFLPALVAAASDDPERLHCILALIEGGTEVQRALAYAQLDFDSILHNVGAADFVAEDHMDLNVTDECLLFEQSNESGRTELGLVSLLKRSRKMNLKDMGSIWNNASAYLSELSILLPIAIRRCPTLITAEQLVDALVTAECGVQLLVTTLTNNPDLVEDAAAYLVSFDRHESEAAPETSLEHKPTTSSRLRTVTRVRPEVQFAISTLMGVCKAAPSLAVTCRDAMVTSTGTAPAALQVTVDLIHDELEFLSGVLFKSSQCLLSCISSQRSMVLQRLAPEEKPGNKTVQLESVVLRLRKSLLTNARHVKEEKGWCPQLHAHIKVYSVLIRTGELHPINEEVDFWLRTLTLEKSFSPGGPASQRTLELGIVFLCLVSNLTAPNTRPLYHGCVSYLLQSVKSAATNPTPTVELTVWLAVQLLLRHFSDIAEFVRESLGVHVTVHNASMRDLAESASSSGISDAAALANTVAALRPGGALSGNGKSRYLACLEQLATGGIFGRWGVDTLSSVMHNIARAREPVPQKLVKIIQASVESPVHQGNGKLIVKVGNLREFLVQAISPAIALCGNGEGSEHLAPAVLACFYVLCREHLLRCTGLEEEQWWPQLISCIPWRRFLGFMERKRTNFEHILPQWLGLASTLYPEKFMASNLLDDMENAETRSLSLQLGVPSMDDPEWIGSSADDLSPTTIKVACVNALSEPLPVVCVLQKMRLRSSSYNWDLSTVMGNPSYWDLERALVRELMPALLSPKCPLKIQEFFCKWWGSLPEAATEHLVVTFYETVRTSSNYVGLFKGDSPISFGSLVREPFIFISCKPQLFRTPLLRIYLEALAKVLVVNRRFCESAASDSVKDGGLKREELAAALTVQDSAVVQSLLERCTENKVLGDDEDPSQLSEARKMICAAIASMFHSNSLLLKLIHFQGYDIQLIPVMLQHVPVMAQTLDFLEELLQQPQVQKQVFAIHLASAVVSRYPTGSQCLPLAQKVVDHVIEIQATVAGSCGFLEKVTGPMADFAIAFPSLTPTVVPFLQQCVQAAASLTHSGPSRDPKLEEAAVSAFKKLVRRNVLHGQLMVEPASMDYIST